MAGYIASIGGYHDTHPFMEVPVVSSTPEKIVDFDENTAKPIDSLQQLTEKGREYLDSTIAAAREHPLAAAAIGAGVVATVAATAYGATKLARRSSTEVEEVSVIDPEVIPQALPIE